MIRSENNEALRWACSNGHLKIVKFLIYNGLTLEDIQSQYNKALRWASKYGHLEDIKSKDNEALRWAIINGNLEVVKYLEEIINKVEF